jgi:hypothetical protein
MLQTDIAAIIAQINLVYKPLVSTLDDAAIDGLYGEHIKTFSQAVAGSDPLYWSEGEARILTVKESFDAVLSKMHDMEISIQNVSTTSSTTNLYTSLASSITAIEARTNQLRGDTFGGNYAFGSGPTLTYPLAQAIEAIGQQFSGWPGTGVTSWSSAFPTLSFSVALSDVTIDTTLNQSVVAGLSTSLSNIYGFVGMSAWNDTSTNYSAYGTLVDISNAQPLEQAVARLDINKLSKNAFAGSHTGFLIRTNSTTFTTLKVNTSAIVPPTVSNDSASNYGIGSRWYDTAAGFEYVCLSGSVGAAVWRKTSSAPDIETVDSDVNAIADGREYLMDTTTSTFKVFLPATATEGDSFRLLHGGGLLSVHSVEVRDHGDTVTLWTFNTDDVGAEVRYLRGAWRFKIETWDS